MRVDDLTVEVRDRDLKRVGQVTPLSLDLKARTRWCSVGEWTLTLPGDHPMVPYLTEPGSGLLVTGPESEITHPREFSPWVLDATNIALNPSFEIPSGSPAVVRRNYMQDPRFTVPANWGVTAGSSTVTDGVMDVTFTAAATSNALTPNPATAAWWTPFVAGDVISAGYLVKNIGGVSATMRIAVWNSATYTYGANITIAPGEEKIVYAENLVVPAGSAYAQPRLHFAPGSPSGERRLLISEPIAEKAATLGVFFTGSATPDVDRTPSWEGAVNGSASVLSEMPVASWSPAYDSAQNRVFQSTRWSGSGSRSMRQQGGPGYTGSTYAYATAANLGMTTGKTYTVMVRTRYDEVPTSGVANPNWGNRLTVRRGTTYFASDIAPIAAGEYDLRIVAETVASTDLFFLGGLHGQKSAWFDDLVIVEGVYTGPPFNSETPSTETERYTVGGTVREVRALIKDAWKEVVYGPLFSGPTRVPSRVRNAQNPDGTYTFSGVTDEVILQGARAFPDPAIADPQLSSRSQERDARSGSTEDLLREYVRLNIAQGAPSGRLRGFRTSLVVPGASEGRGLPQAKSPRFQNLLELLQEMIAYDPDLGFRVVQVDETLEFQVLDARDRTKFIRFDIENGTITSEEVQASGPVVTDAFAAGQGEGKERTIVRRQTPESIAAEEQWGLVFEDFIDQRDTDDLTELEQSGDEALLEGAGGTAVKMVPSDDTTMQVNVDWRQGDSVTTVVSGIETVARVTEVAYSVTSSGIMAGAALGDVSGFSQKDAESGKVQSLDQRVSNLERSGGLMPARLDTGGRQITDWNIATEVGFYWSASGASNAPVAGSMLMGMVVRDQSRIVQEVRDPSALTGIPWRRVYSGGSWGAWVRKTDEILSGTATQRAATTSAYWQKWLDTDGAEALWIGDRTGGWRLAAGRASSTNAAWDASSAPAVYARSPNIVIPTTILPGESLNFSQAAVGSGFGIAGASAIPVPTTTPIVNPSVQFRFMQFLAATTQVLTVNWEVTRVGV